VAGKKVATRAKHAMEVVLPPDKTQEQAMAEIAVNGIASGAHIARLMGAGSFGELGLHECAAVLKEHVRQVEGGSLAGMEAMLVGQAFALNSIFHECTRRASVNLGQNLGAAHTYLRLAMKAQSQSRSTVETLAEVKNPRSVAFVRQANIAAGHQQINNGPDPRAGEDGNPPNKLFEVIHGKPLDARGSGKAGNGNSALEAVGAVNRAGNRRRKGGGQP